MPLKSNLLAGDKLLEACAVADPAHILPGSVGEHVSRIQIALALLDGAQIDEAEALSGNYGRSTTAAVLAFKKRRNIINWTYQREADNIVGRMTIAALDKEMYLKEHSCSRLRWVP
jgi:peptidoglycan hydrolase-like protein with peptidoglycan-binding domain